MLYLDAYIEKCPGFAWEGSPAFNTTVTRLRNKGRRANGRWSQPEWRFTVPFSNTFPEHYQQVLDMHLICRGRRDAFRVRNWLFYKAQAWKFGVGDGVTQEFQLGRLVEIAGQSFLHEVHALSLDPAAPDPVAMVDGSPVSGAAFYDRIGRVVFDTPPAEGAVLTWSGWFDFWVCFATDDFPASIDQKSDGKFVTNYTAELEEVPPPNETTSS